MLRDPVVGAKDLSKLVQLYLYSTSHEELSGILALKRHSVLYIKLNAPYKYSLSEP